MSGGHGWTYRADLVPPRWLLQRPLLAGMNEDYGNRDQMSLFAEYCFNAGATVVPMRPVRYQTNEMVLDNNSPAVTFAGEWFTNTTNPTFFGPTNAIAYHYATVGATEMATAVFTPTIPSAGLYPVYAWAAHGADRISQLYRIRHTGGESSVRVPHNMVGNGWVYLGTYHFDAGSNYASGAVIVSNLEPPGGGSGVVIADAIRFGNGMASIDRGGGISTYPREDECSRYWVQGSLGTNQSTDIFDNPAFHDQDDNVGTPPRMAREMNREAAGSLSERVFLSFHSNASTGITNTALTRGTLGLYNATVGDRTPNQLRWAQIVGQEVNDDMVSLAGELEVPWFNAGSSITLTGSFGEIRANSISGEFDATIIEAAYHDNTPDTLLLRDPKARNWIARAAYHAVVKYMNEFDALPLNFLPEPPTNVRTTDAGQGVQISWSIPAAQAGSGLADGYLIYVSTNGHGFGNPVGVAGGGTTSDTIPTLSQEVMYYFRVAATNAGGESFPSETVAFRRRAHPAITKVLFVNDYDRFDRTINVRQTPLALSYAPPGATGVIDRVIPHRVNSFDYIVPYAEALAAAGVGLDSCQSASVVSGPVLLTNYPIVIWAAGQSISNSLSGPEQIALTNYLAQGRHLFMSGSEIAWELDRAVGPSASDRAFLNNYLHADLVADANTDSQSHSLTPVAASIFDGNAGFFLDDSQGVAYFTQTPDVLTPIGTGTSVALKYGNGMNAALQYNGSAGGGRVVYFGFPFETITNGTVRAEYLGDILAYFGAVNGNLPTNLLAQWKFNSILPDGNPQTGTLAPWYGVGSASIVGGVAGVFQAGDTVGDSAPASDNTAWVTDSYPGGTAGNKTSGVRFNASTVGYKNISVSWRQRAESQASKYVRLQYTTNGSAFIDFPTAEAMTSVGSYESKSNNLSNITSVNGKTGFGIRIVAEFENTATGTGLARYATVSGSGYSANADQVFDMVTIHGEPVNLAATLYPLALVPGNYFQAGVTGAVGASYIVQMSTNLAATNWSTVITNISPFIFTEANVVSPQRFYRALFLP